MPQAPDGIVPLLQAALRLHWSQAEMYDAQAVHLTRWGYAKLGKDWESYAEEERGHIKMLSERLEFYDVQPEVEHEFLQWPRHDFEGILSSNYDTDMEAAEAEKNGFLACTQAGDATSAKLFAKLHKGSEDSMANIEAIRLVIEQIGVDNYLANKVG